MRFLKTLDTRWVLILLGLLILPTFLSLIRPGFYPMQDDLQAFRLHQMNECFKDLQIPCRWIPDMGYQYGYPQFNYYSPSVYYFGEFFRIFNFQFIDIVKILFGLGFIFQGLAMWLFLKEFFNKWAAFLGAVLYVYAPFKAAQVYVRGSLSEFWAAVFFPLIFWAIFKIVKSGEKKYLLWLAIFSGLLLTTHNLMSLIFFPVAGIWALVLILLEKKRKERLLKVGGGFLLGGLLAAFFVLPVLFERQYVHVESILSGYFDYRQHFVNIKQLFISNYFGYGSSVLGDNDEVTMSVGILHWMLGALGILLAAINFKKSKKMAITIFSLALVELIVLFLMHQRSSFIWERLNILVWMQFPWRFLELSVFLLSILGAGVLYYLNEKFYWGKFLLVLTVISGLFVLHQNNFTPKSWQNISDMDKFSGASWEKQLTISIFDYLPIYAELPPTYKAPEKPEILFGKAEVTSYYKGSDYQFGEIRVEESATVRLPLYDFPGMAVRVDNQRVKHENNNCLNQDPCLGLISFNVDPGTHIIKAHLENTPIRTLGNLLSLLALVTVLLFWLPTKFYAKIFKR